MPFLLSADDFSLFTPCPRNKRSIHVGSKWRKYHTQHVTIHQSHSIPQHGITALSFQNTYICHSWINIVILQKSLFAYSVMSLLSVCFLRAPLGRRCWLRSMDRALPLLPPNYPPTPPRDLQGPPSSSSRAPQSEWVHPNLMGVARWVVTVYDARGTRANKFAMSRMIAEVFGDLWLPLSVALSPPFSISRHLYLSLSVSLCISPPLHVIHFSIKNYWKIRRKGQGRSLVALLFEIIQLFQKSRTYHLGRWRKIIKRNTHIRELSRKKSNQSCALCFEGVVVAFIPATILPEYHLSQCKGGGTGGGGQGGHLHPPPAPNSHTQKCPFF